MSEPRLSLPAAWQMTRLDRVATVHARIGWKALTADEYVPEGYAFLATPNIKTDVIDFENVNFITEFRYEESPELKLQVGDVLLSKDGTLGITNLVRLLPRPATVNGSIAVVRTTAMIPAYLRYVLASDYVQGRIGAYRAGMGVPHLFQADIKKLPLPQPPPESQQAIADYLDAETGRIDAVVEARRRQVGLLEARLEAELELWVQVLKDGYGVVPLKRLAELVEQGWSPECDSIPAEGDEWGVLKTSSVSSGTFNRLENKRLPDTVEPDSRWIVRDGDLLVVRGSGSPSAVGQAAVARVDGSKLLLSDLLYRVRLLDANPAFIAAALKSRSGRGQLEASIRTDVGMTRKIRSDDLGGTLVPAAPRSAQHEAIEALSRREERIISLRQLLDRQIDLLMERRQALVTAAVTGQIEIRGVAA